MRTGIPRTVFNVSDWSIMNNDSGVD